MYWSWCLGVITNLLYFCAEISDLCTSNYTCHKSVLSSLASFSSMRQKTVLNFIFEHLKVPVKLTAVCVTDEDRSVHSRSGEFSTNASTRSSDIQQSVFYHVRCVWISVKLSDLTLCSTVEYMFILTVSWRKTPKKMSWKLSVFSHVELNEPIKQQL